VIKNDVYSDGITAFMIDTTIGLLSNPSLLTD